MTGSRAWSSPTSRPTWRRSPAIELGSRFSHLGASLGIPSTTGPGGSLPQLRDLHQRLLGYRKSVVDSCPEVRPEISATRWPLKPSPTHIAQRAAKR